MSNGSKTKPKIHFSGIGGTAMVSGARLALDAGWEVRGSDNPLYPPASEMVKSLGIEVSTGYEASNLDWNPDLVVIGNALSRGNPEVEAVLKRNIPYTSFSEWLKNNLLWKRRPVSICGTHGKTTTTTLTAYLLNECGIDSGFLVGGQPLNFEHSSKLGEEGQPFVIEGDEYDTAFFDKRAKFFHYIPEIAVVTSIEFDHGDIYDSIEQIEKAFNLMLRQIPEDGWLITCADNRRSKKLIDTKYCNTISYGLSKDSDWCGKITGIINGLTQLTVYFKGDHFANLEVPQAGEHNMQNTLAAVAVASILGAEASTIKEAIKGFKGVKRRMEVFHVHDGVTYIDDFAHHPTAIRETIKGVKQRYPGSTIRVLLEPRSNTMVRNYNQDNLIDALVDANQVWLGPIYRSENIPEAEKLDRQQVVDALKAHDVKGYWSDSVEHIAEKVLKVSGEGDVVLILSNGAFGNIYKIFCEEL
jgi:UDP-N-acetylmuramate: L-alanyl-gamma-D-glutamyl-meso-diaminopimelate ligase